jgi:hypothetical protein
MRSQIMSAWNAIETAVAKRRRRRGSGIPTAGNVRVRCQACRGARAPARSDISSDTTRVKVISSNLAAVIT